MARSPAELRSIYGPSTTRQMVGPRRRLYQFHPLSPALPATGGIGTATGPCSRRSLAARRHRPLALPVPLRFQPPLVGFRVLPGADDGRVAEGLVRPDM